MAAKLVGPNDREQVPEVKDAIYNPLNENNQPYLYCMLMPNRQDYLYTDTLDEALEYLIPEYAETEDPTQEAILRIKLADKAARHVQAEILMNYEPDEITDKEFAVLTAPKIGPNAVEAPWWTSNIPLVVITTSYDPYTDKIKPASGLSDGVSEPTNLFWIRPEDPEIFLLSLHEIDYIRLYETVDIEEFLY